MSLDAENVGRTSRRRLVGTGSLLLAIALAAGWWLFWPRRAVDRPLVTAASRVLALQVSPDRAQRYLAAGTSDGRLRLWALANSKELSTKLPSQWPLNSVAWQADGNTVLAAGFEQHVLSWNVPRSQAGKLPQFDSPVTCLVVRPRKPEMLVALSNGDVIWLNLADGERVNVSSGHAGVVKALAYSPDGNQFVSGGADQKVIWHSAETRAVSRTIAAHQNDVCSLAFDASGRRLATGSWDQTVKVWEGNAATPLAVLTHPEPVVQVDWVADAIVTSCWDGQIRNWDVTRQQVTREFPSVEDSLAFAVWSGRPGSPGIVQVDPAGKLVITSP